jgi:hypothetical protein
MDRSLRRLWTKVSVVLWSIPLAASAAAQTQTGFNFLETRASLYPGAQKI